MRKLLSAITSIALGVLIFYLWLRMPTGLKGVVFFWIFPLAAIRLIIGGLITFIEEDED